jgi:hypothetical protein
MRRLSCLIAATLLASAAPAAAQTPPPPPNPNTAKPPPQGYNRPYVFMPSPSNFAMRADYENFLDEASGNNLPPQPLERIDLANRVSTLIELGRCDEARAEANEAGERQMALRARQMCRADRIY